MFGPSVFPRHSEDRERDASASLLDIPEFSEELKRHFRENYPILLDGALSQHADQGHFIRQAKETLAGRFDPDRLPAAILRETLESIHGGAKPSTLAGLTAIGPRRARVWWDRAAVDEVDDILADLSKPRPVLRFYDITGLDAGTARWNSVFDLDVSLKDKGKTVDFWAADRTYAVELGMTHADGRFLCLARTNTATLPRESRGEEGSGATVRSSLRPNPARGRRFVRPDAEARQWSADRPDHRDRDIEAEQIVHMLYRSFLIEGPRVLRSAPLLIRRDSALLEQEFIQRNRLRMRRQQAVSSDFAPAPTLLVTRLDAERPDRPAEVRYPPAPLLSPALRKADETAGRNGSFLLHGHLAAFSRLGAFASRALPAPAAIETPRITREDPAPVFRPHDLVQPASASDCPFADLATPVFEAAAELHRRLTLIDPLFTPGQAKPAPAPIRRSANPGIGELAQSGVRITRTALTLEGRMRPGARLKIAGKTVRADADGCFRIDCVLNDRKNVVSIQTGSKMKNSITVNWHKSAAGKKLV